MIITGATRQKNVWEVVIMGKDIYPSAYFDREKNQWIEDGGALHVKHNSRNTVVEVRDSSGKLTGHTTSIHDKGKHHGDIHHHPDENDKNQDIWIKNKTTL